MKISIHLGKKTFSVDPYPLDLAIELIFNGPQPNTYGVPPARGQAYKGDGFIGDVREGGSVNFETYHLVPHCNGTHTECVGHIIEERVSVHQLLKQSLFLAQVHTVKLEKGSETTDTYDPPLEEDDEVITAESLSSLWPNWEPGQALIIRTLPNKPEKRYRDYMRQPPPFFSLEAMQAVRVAGVSHLLVDFPSIDRLFDEGKLRNHRIFWGLAPGQNTLNGGPTPTQTITEMIYVPDEVADGIYLLELQIASFQADASPSRPRLFRIYE